MFCWPYLSKDKGKMIFEFECENIVETALNINITAIKASGKENMFC